jgi:multiple sugar transport system ATP-binding protein
MAHHGQVRVVSVNTGSGMQDITLRDVTVRYDAVEALAGASLYIERGEFMVLVGASGCGKTTALRAIAGLEQPLEGEIALGPEYVFSAARGIDLAPATRNVGMVFQNYALYPHMTVAENVSFPLRTRRWPKPQIPALLEAVLATVELTGLGDRKPQELSGGQRQRVAIARALVSKPDVLLFDEPLSNVDAMLRASLRADLKRLHRRISATTLYVTHDISEAMALGDRIAVMFDGSIHQVGTPDEVYSAPETLAAAKLFGARGGSLLNGVVEDVGAGNQVVRLEGAPDQTIRLASNRSTYAGQSVVLDLRAEDVALTEPDAPLAGGELQLEVLAAHRHGDVSTVAARLPGNGREVNVSYRGPRAWQTHQSARAVVSRCNLYDAGTERLILRSVDPRFAPAAVRN